MSAAELTPADERPYVCGNTNTARLLSKTRGRYQSAAGMADMAYGGFEGSDLALTVDSLKIMIQNRDIRYFILNGGRGGNDEVSRWVQENGVLIKSTEYGGKEQISLGMDRMCDSQLYDIKDAVLSESR